MHGLNKTLDKLLKREQSKNEEFMQKEEERKKYVAAVNYIASTNHGKYFFKALLKAIGWGRPNHTLDARQLLFENGKDSVYSGLIRPYLTTENKKEIE